MKPRLLDLFCKAGGCTKGYQRAGFHVVGVDLHPQPRYCGDEFVQADAMTFPLGGFDVIHASPPCQAHSSLKSMWNARADHVDLIAATRERLEASGLPYVIENVPGAPLLNPITICGAALGLGTSEGHHLARHRLFELNWDMPLFSVPPCMHGSRPVLGVYGDHARDRRRSTSIGNGQFAAADGLRLAREALGIEWMNWRELSQAIPPAYTELIGHQLMQHLNVSERAA